MYMEKDNILSIEFVNRGQYGEESYDIYYKTDRFGIDGAHRESKTISKQQYDFIQLHLKNIIQS